jgi:hypothetical protein
LIDADLIEGETIAIDVSKSRAHNSKKANFNQKKIGKQLEYIETNPQEYLDALEEKDPKKNTVKIKDIQHKLNKKARWTFTWNSTHHFANRRIRDPYVRWCERRTPSVSGGAVYSISGSYFVFVL